MIFLALDLHIYALLMFSSGTKIYNKSSVYLLTKFYLEPAIDIARRTESLNCCLLLLINEKSF
jgi:hypothetical protein